MNGALARLIPWLTPPLLGAVIGYVTNAIAISMLFRPYTEKRIFGIRVPFTPGIIPKQREKLARSIADMVARELLTQDALKRQILSPQVEENVHRGVSDFTAKLLTTRFCDLKTLLPLPAAEVSSRFRSPGLGGSLVEGFLRSPFFAENAPRLLEKGITLILSRPVDELFTPEELSSAVSSFSLWLSGDEGKRKVHDAFSSWVRRLKAEGKSLRDLLPQDFVERAMGGIDSLYPSFCSLVSAFLHKSETKRELRVRGQRLLANLLEKLNRFQRFLLTAGQYDRTLSENMPEIVDDLIAGIEESLHDSDNRRNIIGSLTDGLSSFIDRPIASFDTELPAEERVIPLIDVILDGAGRLLEREGEGMFVRFFAGKTLAQVASGLSGMEASALSAEIAVRLSDSLVSASSDATSLIVSLLDGMKGRTAGDFISLNEEKKASLDGFLSEGLISIMYEKSQDILSAVDVRSLVKNKIDSLDIMTVERILLDVLAAQFKWINIFGAILGALMGMIQILLALIF